MQTSLLARLGAYFALEDAPNLRERVYEALCLVSALITFLVIIPVNALQALPVSVNAASLGFGGASMGLWLLARRGRRYPTALILALLLLLGATWFPNAGTDGSIPFYFFIPVCCAALLFDGRRMWVLVLLVLAEAMGLVVLETMRPDLVTPFASPHDRTVDVLTGILVSGLSVVLVIRLAALGYRRERERLRVALKSLAETEERFSEIFRSSPDALYIFEPHGRGLLDINDGFTRLTGWTRDAAVGRTGAELGLWVDEEDRQRMYALLSRGGSASGFICRFRSKEGRVFWGSTSVAYVQYGATRAVLMTTRDVTELIESQHAVAESRAQLSTLVNSTDDPIWLVDADEFRLTLFNASFAAMAQLHLRRAPVVGMLLDELLPVSAAGEWRGFYHRVLDEGPFTIEYTIPRQDQVFLHSFSPVRVDGRVTGIAVFGRDITERKRADAERERMELQLFEAQKMESLGRLAGGVAHDFNNMLAGIMGYADLLLHQEEDPGRRHDLEAIIQAASRSAELTSKLLAFGRRGRNIVEAVDLNAIVRESLAMLRPTFGEGLSVDLHLDTTWFVDADPAQMNQLMVNLCINANDAMPHGGRLCIRTRDARFAQAPNPDLPPGEYVELIVEDTGVGMSDEVRQRIFEPFFTTKVDDAAPGTGLGLSTVYGIVHLYRGAIDVQSTPGHGARFVVLLPKGILAPAMREVPPPNGTGAGLVLIVEDEPLLRRFASTALVRLGYRTLTANDGDEATEIFRARHTSLTGVLLYLRMPRKNGRDTFLAMRDIDPSVPILICSGYGDNEEAQGLISLGARGLLPKPYRVSDLADQMTRLTRVAQG